MLLPSGEHILKVYRNSYLPNRFSQSRTEGKAQDWLLNTSVNISLMSKRNNHFLQCPLDHQSLTNHHAALDRVLRKQENKQTLQKGNQETGKGKVISEMASSSNRDFGRWAVRETEKLSTQRRCKAETTMKNQCWEAEGGSVALVTLSWMISFFLHTLFNSSFIGT